jgi:hypothetical protein
METLLVAIIFPLPPFPVFAENWMFVTNLSDGSSVSIDANSMKRRFKEVKDVTFQEEDPSSRGGYAPVNGLG